MCSADCFLAILAVFFPPIAVWIKVGLCTADSVINLALCCLGYVPGLLHAWYIIIQNPEPEYDNDGYEPITPGRNQNDAEGGTVTYYYVSHNRPQFHEQQQHYHHPRQEPVGYGATAQPPQQPPHLAGPTVPSNTKSASQPPMPAGPAGQGSSGNAGTDDPRQPPTYAEAVKGDHKVQTDE